MIAGNAGNIAVFKPLGDARGGIAGIQSHGLHIKAKTLTLAIKLAEIGDAVMHICRRGVGVGDDGVAPIHRAMIELEEARGLAVAHHVATLRIGAGDF